MLVFGRAPEWDVVGISAALIVAIFVGALVLFKKHRQVLRGRDLSAASAIQLEQRLQAVSHRPLADGRRSGRLELDRCAARPQPTKCTARRAARSSSTIHALRDVSFEVPEGAGLGIIGRNGAGKTTLLKLISRVTWPTSGKVRVAGHVVSLIELGAGFHPELTGRENVYLGAGLFGLTRKEIDRQFDAIVQFADVERLIDTPMKRYSSGLYARLGFSVAIHSNPDIVLVDEVLSVGDAAFRRRALEALRGLIATGKTVLFISHDMWNVRRLCSQILWMEEGQVRAYGDAGEIAERYMNEVNLQALANQGTALQSHRGGTGEVRYEAVETLDGVGRAGGALHAGRRAGRARVVPRGEAGRAAGVPGRDRRRRHRRGRDHGELSRARRRRAASRAAARSMFGSTSCRCGRASTCCACRSPTAISWRRTTR